MYPVASYKGLSNRPNALTERKIHGAVGNQTPTIRQVATLLIRLIPFFISYILPTHAPYIIKTLYKHIKISQLKSVP